MFGNTSLSMEQLLGVATKKVATPQNVRQDKYDGTLYRELEDTTNLARLAGRDDIFKGLLQDVWASYYKAAPELADESNVDPLYQANRPLVQRLHEDTETQRTRLTTQLDELSSALATLATGQALQNEFEQRQELQEARNLMRRAQQAQQAGQEEAAQALAEQAREQLEQNAVAVRRAVRESIKEGNEAATEGAAAIAGWGLEPGDLQAMPMQERLELVKRLQSPRLARMTDLVGRMKNLARAKQKAKTKKGRDEIHSITLGNELQHLLPTELAALKHPLRRLDFMRRYTEGQLLQYDLKSKEPQGRGPMVVLVDQSGSMQGSRIEWAIATALALVDTAQRQKRQAAVLFFNNRPGAEYHFTPSTKNPEQLLQMAQEGCDGGTEYWQPISRALQLIAAKGAYQNADVVLITDGECRLGQEQVNQVLAAKELHKFKIYSLIIQSQAYDSMGAWVDKLWQLPAVEGETAAQKLFEEVY
jgi:uncharacterized protein with von Willebrand factor type A (vWA) domain